MAFPHPAVLFFAVALVTTLFLAPGRRTRAIFLLSFLGLEIALVSVSPLRMVGDAGEYVAMAVNLGRLAPPSLSEAEIAEARTFVPGDAGLRLDKPWLKAPDGRQDFPHFWFYSLIAAPFVRAAEAAGSNPLAGFRFLNLALLFALVALLAVRASLPVALFVGAGPVIWWADKAHTEVLTTVLLAAAFALLRSSPWLSILALGAAAAQNTPIAGALVLVIAWAFFERGPRDRRLWFAAAVALATAALHPLYYHSRLGVWTGIYDAIDRHLPSFPELTAVAFDPNLGLFTHDPLLLVALVIAGFDLATQSAPKRFDAAHGTLAVIALLFLVSFTQTTNFNHGGTPGVSRYGLWLVPFAVPLLSAVRSDTVWLRVLAGGSVVWCAWTFAPALPDEYLRPSPLAAELWRRWPDLDNPLAEVFAERVAGRESARPPAATEGCEKVLLIGDGAGAAWPARCTSVEPPEFCRAKDAVCYGNRTAGRYKFVLAPWSPAWRVGVTRNGPSRFPGVLVVTQSPDVPGSIAIWHAEGWSYPERLSDSTPDVSSREWRWIEGRADIGVTSTDPVGARLKIVARSFNRARRMKISLNDAEIATIDIAEPRGEYQTPVFALGAGTSDITLESLEEGESPATGDPRRLSIAVFGLELVATKR